MHEIDQLLMLRQCFLAYKYIAGSVNENGVLANELLLNFHNFFLPMNLNEFTQTRWEWTLFKMLTLSK